MSENPERQPDVEIYVKRVDIGDILGWIGRHFSIEDQQTAGTTLKLALAADGAALTCTIAENVTRGGYTSIWFDSSNTPWRTDEECAQEAFDHFQVEVRCSANGWSPDQGDEGGWYRFTPEGKSVVNWLS